MQVLVECIKHALFMCATMLNLRFKSCHSVWGILSTRICINSSILYGTGRFGKSCMQVSYSTLRNSSKS